jgi:hypothetical protein
MQPQETPFVLNLYPDSGSLFFQFPCDLFLRDYGFQFPVTQLAVSVRHVIHSETDEARSRDATYCNGDAERKQGWKTIFLLFQFFLFYLTVPLGVSSTQRDAGRRNRREREIFIVYIRECGGGGQSLLSLMGDLSSTARCKLLSKRVDWASLQQEPEAVKSNVYWATFRNVITFTRAVNTGISGSNPGRTFLRRSTTGHRPRPIKCLTFRTHSASQEAGQTTEDRNNATSLPTKRLVLHSTAESTGAYTCK